MGYKQMDTNFSFTDLSLANSMGKNRSLFRIEKINGIINWSYIEKLFLKHYAIGKKTKRVDAYLPLRDLVYFAGKQKNSILPFFMGRKRL